MDISAKKNLRGRLVRSAAGVGAAFGHELVDDPAHRRIVGAAEQGRAPALLRDQPDRDQLVQVVRERRARDLGPLLDPPDREAGNAVIGGRDTTSDGVPIYYEARFHQMSLIEGGQAVIDPIHSEIESQSIELNDVIRFDDWTFNVGLVFSNDQLYGQGLTEAAGT